MRKILFRLICSAVVIGVGVTSALLASSDAHGGTPTYAQVESNDQTLDIWKSDGTNALIFQFDGSTNITRYDPDTFTLTDISDGTVVEVNSFTSSAAAWASIDDWFGVTQGQVGTAMESGASSPAPPSADVDVSSQDPRDAPYDSFQHYGSDVSTVSTATGAVVPRRTALDGYALEDAAVTESYGWGPADSEPPSDYTGSGDSGAVVSLWYGQDTGDGNDDISVDIAQASSANPTAWGTIYERMFASSSFSHYESFPTSGGSPTEFCETGPVSIIFPYGNEWIGVHTSWAPSDAEWSTIIQAIVTAPTQ
jgi:hypothetical protein